MDSSVHSDTCTLSDSEENNDDYEHKHDHDGWNLENSVDEADMDDPMDITSTPR